ncbi:glucose-6-phosphate isomerase [Rhodohalobacter sulfatireducens]|uniref:Glucose-6-phosphate isomerase n=1 Tax=Rhodohalobacter sulfatireducens TaxID=2911366 RepID=A0ABS9KF66_9BACT|nr:glucose-6-phosphate isomerase [Rhodohalobacter sulfatireducens]MCG2589486.1 glucose-6-phosphate isomerase [Rhodohalobacter sulfatireducens]
MITTDVKSARSFVSDDEYAEAFELAEKTYQQVKNQTGAGSEWLGWQRILKEPNDAELEELTSHAERIREDADIFIVCGIGGSYTGAMAVIKALNPYFKNNGPEILYAGHHMSGKYLKQLMEYLQTPKEDGELKSVYLNGISKSGSTLETALAFRTIRAWMHEVYEDAADRIIATTGKEGGVMNKIVAEEGYQKYIIPDDVGGRFSVLTPVGLLPIAVAGIDIQTLYYGAVSEYEGREQDQETILEYAALRYALLKNGHALDVLTSFEPELIGFTAWIQQLLGESEGKEGKGMFPAMAGYSTDLHSIGQIIQEGRRNLIETILVAKKPISDFKVQETQGEDIDQLGYLSGRSFHQINKSALDGTVEAHTEGGVPVLKIIIEELNAQQLGKLIYFYELFTAVYVYMLDVNPFNQPGVEGYKKAMYKLLGKDV